MKKFFSEFKTFIARGNVMDLAIGMIIGSAFTAIVNSLVNDIVMPFIGWLVGGMDFSALKIQLNEEAAIYYGQFIQNIISFIAIAFVVFCLVKAINTLHRKKEEEPAAPAEPSDEAKLLTEIRDLLKQDKAE